MQEEGDDDDDDNTEGFVEVLQDMTVEEREQWQTEVEPVRTVLFKVSMLSVIFPSFIIYLPAMLPSFVLLIYLLPLSQARKISSKINNSTTLLLPRWREQVSATSFKNWILPRDVATWWNSTYDMLAAFVEMKDPVSKFLDRSSNGMAEFLISDEEWDAIEGLVSALRVFSIFLLSLSSLTNHFPDSQRCYNLFLFKLPHSCFGHPCYGCHWWSFRYWYHWWPGSLQPNSPRSLDWQKNFE
jgi:hypothetical protein